IRLPPISITRPAGVLTVPFGVVEVCHAGVRRTATQSRSTVPPMLGSRTSWSPPRSSEISLASSTMATTGAPVRLAMSTVSPMWSAWPWVRKIASASTSSAFAAAFGLPVRNGSTRTVLPSCSRAKAECPRKRMFMVGSISLVEFSGQLQADGDAHEHPQARLLGQQRPDGELALARVVGAGHLGDLPFMGLAEPSAGVQRLVEDALEPRGGVGDDLLGVGEAVGIARQRLDGGVDLLGGETAFRHGIGDDTGVSTVALTSLSHGAGCGCKLPAAALHPLVAGLPAGSHSRGVG